MYYFAYGSNMNHRQMKERCGEGNFKFIGKAYLKGYRFTYDGFSSFREGAVANIVKLENEIVWGALYEINEFCLSEIDKYEGYPNTYTRKKLKVVYEDNEFEAWVYLREPQKKGKPSKEYEKIVLEGAKHYKLPDDYIKKYIQIEQS